MVPFGELVLSRRPGAHLHKAESWFVYGAWVGRDGRTDEHLVLTKAGVVRSRAVRRLTPDRCWSTMLVDEMKWTPWKTSLVQRGRPPKQQEEQEPIQSAPMPTAEAAFSLPQRAGPAPPMGGASAAPAQPGAGGPAAPAQPAAGGPAASSASGAGGPAASGHLAAATPIPVEAEKRPAEQASAASEEAPSPKRDRTAGPTVEPGARGGLAPAARLWLLSPDEAQTSAAAASSASPPLSAETRPSTPPAPGTATKKQRTAEPTIHEVNEVSTVCEAEEGESATDLMASSSEGVSRVTTARRTHLKVLQKHGVYEAKKVPPGVRPLTCRWVDRDDGTKAKSRLTARGYEQRLTGDEQFYSHTPLATTLRTLLVVAQSLGYSVAVGDCQDAFLQAPIQEQEEV